MPCVCPGERCNRLKNRYLHKTTIPHPLGLAAWDTGSKTEPLETTSDTEDIEPSPRTRPGLRYVAKRDALDLFRDVHRAICQRAFYGSCTAANGAHTYDLEGDGER